MLPVLLLTKHNFNDISSDKNETDPLKLLCFSQKLSKTENLTNMSPVPNNLTTV